ncbi:MAG: type II toxin-antitoxin system RelE/ParE family toxin [Pseudonocardiaceae bacterium]
MAEAGPNLGRPLADRIKGSTVHNLKELRPGSVGATEVRVLFVFDPWRSAILLVAGDKAGNWSGWYRQAIPRAEQLYEVYLKQRATEEEGTSCATCVGRTSVTSTLTRSAPKTLSMAKRGCWLGCGRTVWRTCVSGAA